MKATVIGGILLGAVGIFVLMKSPSMTTHHEVMQVGDLKVSAEDHQSLPPWLGGVLIVSGVLVVAVGMRSRRMN